MSEEKWKCRKVTSLARILTFHASLFSSTFSFSILYTHHCAPSWMMLVAMLLTPLSYRTGSWSPCLLFPDLPPKEKVYAASTQDFPYLVSMDLVSGAADCPEWWDTINSPMLFTACCCWLWSRCKHPTVCQNHNQSQEYLVSLLRCFRSDSHWREKTQKREVRKHGETHGTGIFGDTAGDVLLDRVIAYQGRHNSEGLQLWVTYHASRAAAMGPMLKQRKQARTMHQCRKMSKKQVMEEKNIITHWFQPPAPLFASPK